MIHWLASFPKSGNTWVRSFLTAYQFGTIDINRLDFVCGDNQFWFFQLASPLPYHQLGMYEWACIRLSALYSMKVAKKYTPFLVKTHNANANIRDVPLIPNGLTGNSVYLIRDPRDVAISYASHMGVDIDTAIGNITNEHLGSKASTELNALPQLFSSWDRNVYSWRKRDYCIVVRYEDLLAQPEIEFRRILDHYGIDYSQEKFETAFNLTRFDRLQKMEAEAEGGFSENSPKQERFFRKGKAGGWQNELTAPQVERLETALGEEMRRHGYELTLVEAA